MSTDGTIFQIDDTKQMAWIWVAAVDPVTKNRNVRSPRLRHHKKFVNGALKSLERLFNLVSLRIDKQDLRPHLVDADHPRNVFHV